MVPICSTKLDVLIVGSGIAGLTAAVSCQEKGFNVQVLESLPKFSHLGAGLMISANASRILCDMGLRESLEKCGSHMRRVVFKKFDDGAILDERLYGDVEKDLGGPNWQIHRADLHDVLLEKAQELGVTFLMGSKVKKYDWEGPAAMLEDGTTITSDVVIVADGYRSRGRAEMLGKSFEPRFSGNSAYRAIIPRSEFENDPELAGLLQVETQCTNVWVGEGCHLLGYPIRRGEFYNVVATQPAIRTKGLEYVVPATAAEFHDYYAHWDPQLEKILSKLPEGSVLEWKLCDLEPLDSWVFPGGKIVMIGDASHAMLPSAAQGAGMGIEDGAAIAELLARATDISQIPALMNAFQQLRLPRCTEVVDTGRQNSKKWHEKDPKGGTVTDDIWHYDVKSEARQMIIDF